MIGDSKHNIYIIEGLPDYVTLHRFTNPGGVPYSAVYIGDYEAYSHERKHEQRMIADFRKNFKLGIFDDLVEKYV